MKKIFWCILALLVNPCVQGADDTTERLAVYQYALYLLPSAKGDPVDTLNSLVESEFSGFSIITEVDGPPSKPLLILTMLDDVQASYAPPDMESIGYAGRGLSREQALAVQKSEKALIIDIGYPARLTPTAFPEALEMMAALAFEHNSLIWDEATREIFTIQAWREQRIDTWNDGLFSAQDHTTIHAYKNGDYVRAITLGMEKFGQPDIVVNDFGWSISRSIGSLINLVTQTLIEGGDFNDDLSLDVDIQALKNDRVREELLASLLDNAEREVRLQFQPEEPEDGDPDNFILEIRFDTVSGVSTQEQQDVLLSKLFGSEDSITYVEHDAELVAASEAARAKLPQLRSDFNNGLEPGEFLYLKAPFVTSDGGNEWMWVEVIEWDGEIIRGLLQNDPFHVPDLRAGSEVNINMDEIFDYIRYLSDGTSEGNETGRILQKHQQQ